MLASITRRAVAAAAVLMLTAGLASADNQTKTDEFQLTRGDFTELTIRPGTPGLIKLEADWKGTGVAKKDVALRMQLVRSNGSVLKEVIGGSPLPLAFNLSATEFDAGKGGFFKVVLRHNVAGQDDEKVKGTLRATFPAAAVTVFNNSANPLDLGGKGSKTEVSFAIPNKPGKLEVDIAFRDGLFDGTKMLAQLVRADGVVVVAKSGNSGLDLDRTVTAADSAKGLTWKVRLTNNNDREVKGIKIVARFTPN